MSLDQTTLNQLQNTRTSVEEWRDKEVARIEEDAEFLKRVRAPVSALSLGACEAATDSAEELIDTILGA